MTTAFASSQPDLHLLARLERVRAAGLAASFAFAFFILLAWLIPALAQALPDGWWLMQANTAFAIAVLAASLAFAVPGNSTVSRAAGWAGAVVVAALAAWILLEHAGLAPFSLDTALAPDPYSAHAGRPSAQTAVTLLLIALALPFLPLRKSAAAWLVDGVVALVILLWLVFLAGYIFGASLLFGESAETRISLLPCGQCPIWRVQPGRSGFSPTSAAASGDTHSDQTSNPGSS